MGLTLKKPKKESDIYPDKLLITLLEEASKINTFSLNLGYGKWARKHVKTRDDSATFDAQKIQPKA